MSTLIRNTDVQQPIDPSYTQHLARTSDGRLWVTFYDEPTATLATYVSTDNGTTWADGGSFAFSSSGNNEFPVSSLFIDSDDYFHVIYRDRYNADLTYRRGTLSGSSVTWSAPVTVTTALFDDDIDMVAHAHGSGWKVHLVTRQASGFTQTLRYYRIDVSSGGAFVVEVSAQTVYETAMGESFPGSISLDFHHTGDSKTVKGGTPHLFLTYADPENVPQYRMATYSGGSWTWGSAVAFLPPGYVSNFDSGGSQWHAVRFDGTRVLLGGVTTEMAATPYLFLYERDVANTTSTQKVLQALSAGQELLFGSMTYDLLGNVHFIGRADDEGSGQDDIERVDWDRATGTLTWTRVDASVGNLSVSSFKRGGDWSSVEYVFLEASSAWGPLHYDALVLNVAPNAPTLTAPADGATLDRAIGQTFTWAFSDPDGGDSQSAYSLRYRPVGTSTWTDTGWQSSAASTHLFAGGTFAEGDYEWQVATKDAQGVEGPWSSSSYFTAATAPNAPTVTDPANGATIGSESYTLQWSTPNQSAYQVQVLDGSTVVDDTGQVDSSTARSRGLTFPTNNVSRTIRVRVTDGGLWSAWATVDVLVSYTEPATPIVSVVELVDDAALRVDVLNPAPTGDQPAVISNDVDVDDGTGWERRKVNLAANGSWTYWTPISGRDYAGRIRVKAHGDNGTSATVVVT